MQRGSHRLRRGLLVGFSLVLIGGGGVSLSAEEEPGDRPVPARVFEVLNPAPEGPTQVELGTIPGTKPVIFCYWIAGNARSEEMLQELDALVEEEGRDRVALFGLAFSRPGRGAELIRERIRAMGIRAPVLEDENYTLGSLFGVASVPHVTILDAKGRLRLTNGASLHQVLEYKLDLEDAVRKVVRTGELGFYGKLDRYYPVKEMVGKKVPDLKAPLLSGDEDRRLSQLLDTSKLNVLVFWSVDCGHCRRSLPELDDWLEQQPERVNVISIAGIDSETTRVKTREFSDTHTFRFPTLLDYEGRIGRLFQVTTTPTVLLVDARGTIDSVLVSGVTDIGKAIERRLAEGAASAGS